MKIEHSKATLSFPCHPPTEIAWVGPEELLAELSELIIEHRSAGGVLLVVDQGVNRKGKTPYHARLIEGLAELTRLDSLILPGGEKVKQLATLRQLYDALLRRTVGRDGLVIALGGGALMDLAAFAASTWHRGTRLVLVPTTLVGQVDAAVGGKTALNWQKVKNQVGTFYPARKVLICPYFIETLSTAEFRNGIAEAIKTAFLFDPELVDWLEEHRPALLEREAGALVELSQRCLVHKGELTELDPYDRGKRRLLNFGHTFGHALETWGELRAETLKNPKQRIPHGRAIAWGMVVESMVSRLRGELAEGYLERLSDLLQGFGLPTQVSLRWVEEVEVLWELIRHDKKRQGERVSFVKPLKIGLAELASDLTREELEQALLELAKVEVE